uniref:Uncharacterized protein n=1 Tax=Acrobeloides nanus TaxID=290746 RepID=A0A914CGH4_9BILA
MIGRTQESLDKAKESIHHRSEQFYTDFANNHAQGEYPNSPVIALIRETKAKDGNYNKFVQRVHYTTNMADGLKNADLAIESVYERLNVKQDIMEQMEIYAPKHCVLVTNTSSLRPSDICAKLKNKGNFGGLHFYNPVEQKRFLEVGAIETTSPETLKKLLEYTKQAGKTYAICGNVHGFLSNRMMIPVRSEALYMYDNGLAKPEDIDLGIKIGYEIKYGPFEYMDKIGLDTVKDTLDGWYNLYKDEVFIRPPSKKLAELVAAGKLGEKTGEGFYKWKDGKIVTEKRE